MGTVNNLEPFLYILDFYGTKVMLSSGFPISDLTYLSMNTKYSKKMKTDQETNQYITPDHYLTSTVRFNLQILQHIDFKDISYYLVCNQRDILMLHYLLKLKTFKATIICTKATYQIGQLYVKEVVQKINERNKNFYNNIVDDYFKESEAFQQFEDEFNINYQEFAEIFDYQENFPCTQVSYGQIIKIPLYTVEETLEIEILSDGYEIGSAYYEFRLGKYFRMAFANYLSFNYNVNRPINSIKIKGLDCLILANNKQYEGSQRIQTLLKDQQLVGKNIMIPFFDHQFIIEMSDFIDDYLVKQNHKIFIISSEFNYILQLANSLVESLNFQLQANIMKDPPNNPFYKLLGLIKAQKIIIVDDVQDIKFDQISLQTTINEATPSVYFIYDSSFRLSQNLFLVDLLEMQSKFNQSNIYQNQHFSNNFSFAIVLQDKDFINDRLLKQVRDQYNYKEFIFRYDKASHLQDIQDNVKAKQYYFPKQSNQQHQENIIYYGMSQNIPISLNKFTLDFPSIKYDQQEQQIPKTHFNIQFSKADIQIKQQNKTWNVTIKRQQIKIQYILGNALEKIRDVNHRIQKQYPYELRIMSEQELIYSNHGKDVLKIKIYGDKSQVYADDPQLLKDVDRLLREVLDIRKF
ncbi:hypothetical protein pb186bvf_017929 [Paramecium bursaria]